MADAASQAQSAVESSGADGAGGSGGAGGSDGSRATSRASKSKAPKKPGVMMQLEDLVIRPPRACYSTSSDLLGGPPAPGVGCALFVLGGRAFCRVDREVPNERGERLHLSYYHPAWFGHKSTQQLPAVIYAHGNSGCRCDANDVAALLLPQNICVVALDFAGSGKSDGEYVTLGAREMADLGIAKEWLMRRGRTSCVGLWGRSMGSVASLLYARRDPSVAGLVLDSVFSRLQDVAMELVRSSAPKMPGALTRSALWFMRRGIRRRAGFDINELDALSAAAEAWIPALFLHGLDDTMIAKHHSEKVHAAYSGDKNLILFEGDHNDMRPQFAKDSASIFWYNTLRPPSRIEGEVEGCAPHAKDLLYYAELMEVMSADERRKRGSSSAAVTEQQVRQAVGSSAEERVAVSMPKLFGMERLARDMRRHADTADDTRNTELAGVDADGFAADNGDADAEEELMVAAAVALSLQESKRGAAGDGASE